MTSCFRPPRTAAARVTAGFLSVAALALQPGCGTHADAVDATVATLDAPSPPDECVPFVPRACGQSDEIFAGRPYTFVSSFEESGFIIRLALSFGGADARGCAVPPLVVSAMQTGDSWPLTFVGTQPVTAVIYGESDTPGELTIDSYERSLEQLPDGTYGSLTGRLRLDFPSGSQTATLALPICTVGSAP